MKKKGYVSTFILIVLLIMGLSLLLYPTVSDAWNTRYNRIAIDEYTSTVETIASDHYQKMWDAAMAFTDQRRGSSTFFDLSDSEMEQYN